MSESKVDPAVVDMIAHEAPFVPGRPDEIDALLLKTMAEWQHEKRMEQIRTLDVEKWAREQYE